MNIIKLLCLIALALSNRSLAMNGVPAIEPSIGHALEESPESISPDTAPSQLNAKLIEAADHGNLEQVKLLISQGADVEAEDDQGWTPLMCAASWIHSEWPHYEICELLIRHNAQVNPKFTNNGRTPLALAAVNRNTSLCYLFLDEILKPIKQMPAAIVTFLGISKMRKADCLSLVGRDGRGMIASQIRQAFENTAQEKQNLLAQIEEVCWIDIKWQLLKFITHYPNPPK